MVTVKFKNGETQYYQRMDFCGGTVNNPRVLLALEYSTTEINFHEIETIIDDSHRGTYNFLKTLHKKDPFLNRLDVTFDRIRKDHVSS